MTEEETYDYNEECSNCGEDNEFEIPKRKTVKDFMVSQKCFNCDCLIKQ